LALQHLKTTNEIPFFEGKSIQIT